jgi:hypothetical protein
MLSNLIDLYRINECENGKISLTNRPTKFHKYMENRMGEMMDVWNVVNGRKIVAGLDLSNKGRKFLSTLDKNLINTAITIFNSNIKKGDLVVLHNNTKNRMYLKTIVAKKENINIAIKLMYVLWCNPTDDIYKYHFWIGILLGYSLENILYFIKRNYKVGLSNHTIMDYYITLQNLRPDISELDISIMPYIEYL